MASCLSSSALAPRRFGNTCQEWNASMLKFLGRNVEVNAKLAALDRSNAVIEFDLAGTILAANENFLHATGYSLREIQGKHHGMFVEPALRDSRDYQEFWQ